MKSNLKNLKNKHIVVFIPNLSGGGAERVISIVCNQIVELNGSCTLVVVKKVGPYFSTLDARVKIIELTVNKTLLSVFPLYKILKSLNPDALFSTLDNANIVSILAAKLSKTRVVIRQANTISFSKKNKSLLTGLFIYTAVRLLYPFANKIIAVSQGVLNDLCEFNSNLKNNSKVHHSPLFEERFLELATMPSTKLDFPSSELPLIVAIGRLTNQKNFASLLSAISLLNNPCNLAILGEGELRSELEDLILKLNLKDHVHLVGFVENPFPILKQADVFALPSHWEGLSGALIQALALGKTVVVNSQAAGNLEVIYSEKIGYISKSGSPIDIKNTLERALNKKIPSEIPAKRAEDFSPQNTIPAIISTILG